MRSLAFLCEQKIKLHRSGSKRNNRNKNISNENHTASCSQLANSQLQQTKLRCRISGYSLMHFFPFFFCISFSSPSWQMQQTTRRINKAGFCLHLHFVSFCYFFLRCRCYYCSVSKVIAGHWSDFQSSLGMRKFKVFTRRINNNTDWHLAFISFFIFNARDVEC